MHDLTVVTTQALEARLDRLDTWPVNYADAVTGDTLCACDPDCEWDNMTALELEWSNRA